MKSHNKVINGFTLMAIAFTIMLVTSPVVAATPPVFDVNLDTFSTTPNVELASVVAGIDTAVYASIFTFGGNDGSSLELDTSDDGFTNALSWVVASLNQDDFGTYLQRSPFTYSCC